MSGDITTPDDVKKQLRTENISKPIGESSSETPRPLHRELQSGPNDGQNKLSSLDLQGKKADVSALGFPQIELVGDSKAQPQATDTVKPELTAVQTSDAFGQPTVAGYKINLDVAPSKHVVGPGESLEDVARQHLPKDASLEHIQKHAEEIRLLNRDRISEPSAGKFQAAVGETLILPGHTKDGSVLYADSRGTNFAYDQAGRLTVNYKDGTGYIRSAEGSGRTAKVSYEHFGPSTDENFSVVYRAGKIIENTKPEKPARSLVDERAALFASANKHIMLEKERKEFGSNMQEFEKRASKDHLSDQEVARVYRDLGGILSTTDKSPLTERERVRLATQALRAIAEPKSNDQGAYETCQVAAIENRIYAEEPSTATSILSQIAQKGKFVTVAGTHVDMDATNLRAHGQAAFNEAAGTGVRTYESQVFEMAARNAFLVRMNEGQIPPGDFRLLQKDDPRSFDSHGKERSTGGGSGGGSGGGRGGSFDNVLKMGGANDHAPDAASTDGSESVRRDLAKEEGLVEFDFRSDPPRGIASSQQEVSLTMMLETYQQLTGKFSPERQISHTDTSKFDFTDVFGKQVSSLEQLKDYLAKQRSAKSGDLYTIVSMPGDSEILAPGESNYFSKIQEPSDIVKAPSSHVLNIIDYDATAGTVKLDNQWGNDRDYLTKPVSVAQLYESMKPVSGKTWMQRLANEQIFMDDNQFAKQLSNLTLGLQKRWQVQVEHQGLALPQDVEETIAAYGKLKQLRPDANYQDADKTMREVERLRKIL